MMKEGGDSSIFTDEESNKIQKKHKYEDINVDDFITR